MAEGAGAAPPEHTLGPERCPVCVPVEEPPARVREIDEPAEQPVRVTEVGGG